MLHNHLITHTQHVMTWSIPGISAFTSSLHAHARNEEVLVRMPVYYASCQAVEQ